MDHLLLYEIKEGVAVLTLNRPAKSNAFNEALLSTLQSKLDEALTDPRAKVILINANGQHFSAGADADWMQRMAQFTEQENLADAEILARLMSSLFRASKPTIAAVQGGAFGGGAGLAAACDITIAAQNAAFCFSEVRLGLIPAVISPYVVQAIGARLTKWLFITAEKINAQRALDINLVHYCIPNETLQSFAFNLAKTIQTFAPIAVGQCKTLVDQVANRPINDELILETAVLIAEKRVSSEAQHGLHAFLNKTLPKWNP